MPDNITVTNKVVPDNDFQPTRLRLYGVELKSLRGNGFDVNIKVVTLDSADEPIERGREKPDEAPKVQYELALIYGYSYEGHCYTLPRPCAIVVLKENRIDPATGCGFEGEFLTREPDNKGKRKTKPVRYSMWLADKLHKTLEVSVRKGFIEEIILDQNVAGPKAPVAYSTKVQLAHRGGKLNDY